MKAAFHFIAERFGGSYGRPIQAIVFQRLLEGDLAGLDLVISTGDLRPDRIANVTTTDRDDQGRVVRETIRVDKERWPVVVEELLGEHLDARLRRAASVLALGRARGALRRGPETTAIRLAHP